MTTHTEHAEPAGVHEPGRPSPRVRHAALVVGVLILLLAAASVVYFRLHRSSVESSERGHLERQQARGLYIQVTRVETTPPQRTVTLPGDVHGFQEATLYAKISGYVRDVRVERGQRVKRGDLLATIESPETVKEVAQALHDARISQINAERAQRLEPSGVVAKQEMQNAVAQARIAQAALGRAQAMLQYTQVRAPFDGVISARFVDPGALLPAATGSTQSALPVVAVADVGRLRIFVYAGQDVAPFVRPGDAVTLWQDELRRRIPAKVTFTTGALDPRSRTMQVEIDLDNRSWGMLPGTFAHVDLTIAEPPTPVAPDGAVVIRDGRTMVALVQDDRVHYVPVELGYNDGRQVRVLHGLNGGETIGLDVPVQVQEGEAVQPVPHQQAAAE
jgi:RND family efflux transporter MFP subunit